MPRKTEELRIAITQDELALPEVEPKILILRELPQTELRVELTGAAPEAGPIELFTAPHEVPRAELSAPHDVQCAAHEVPWPAQTALSELRAGLKAELTELKTELTELKTELSEPCAAQAEPRDSHEVPHSAQAEATASDNQAPPSRTGINQEQRIAPFIRSLLAIREAAVIPGQQHLQYHSPPGLL